jgi:membrane-associated phospholipid phosphatase
MVVAVRSLVAVLALLLCQFGPLTGQSILTDRSYQPTRIAPTDSAAITRVVPTAALQSPTSDRLREVGLMIGIFGTAVAASAHDGPAPLSCGPCAETEVPGFDRWAITGLHETWDGMSSATLIAMAGLTWIDLYRGSEAVRFTQLRASLQSAAFTYALTDLLKQSVGRRRPFTYRENISDLSPEHFNDARASWPSGHTSVAFALGTSYWLSRKTAASPTIKRIILGATILTGLLRVPAGRHFPSDVLSGAALGVGSALLVHTIRF